MEHLAEVGSAYDLVGIAGIYRCECDSRWDIHPITFLISQIPADIQLLHIRTIIQMITKLSVHIIEMLTGS